MGSGLLKLYQNSVKREWKIAFVFSVIFGFLVHMFVFTNSLLNHDALYNFYSNQNIVGSGRWFLTIACGLSSFFNLPWLIGVLSVLFLALTAVVIVDLFAIQNPILLFIVCGLLVSFPAITETFYFEFTADGYMIAMLLAAMTVRLSVIGSSRQKTILAMILICLACGIYQAYVSFALVLALSYIVVELLDGRHETKSYLAWIRKQIIVYGCGMLLYYLIWKLCLTVQSYTATSYQGIDQLGSMSVSDLLHAAEEALYSFGMFFVQYNFLRFGITTYIALNLLFLLFGLLVVITAIRKSRIYRRMAQLVLLLLAGVAIPFASYIWYFASTEVYYGVRMEQGMCICFILVAVLAEKWLMHRWSSMVGLLLAACVFHNSVTANLFYYYMNQCNEQTYATAIEISTRIHQLDDGSITSIVIVGGLDTWENDDYYDTSKLASLAPICNVNKNLLQDENYVALYLQNVLGFELTYYRENPEAELPTRSKLGTEPVAEDWTLAFPLLAVRDAADILQSEEYMAMSIWPSANSVAVIGDSIVVKLSEPEE